jgi:glycosyltransferase involved in cell wall biosynthesis
MAPARPENPGLRSSSSVRPRTPPRRELLVPMSMRVAINGFGRVGRSFVRVAHEQDAEIEVVAVNDLVEAHTLAHLLKYDSVFGRFPGEVTADEEVIPIDIRCRAHLAALPMSDVEENAAIVNALQRHAEVIVHNSLAEGYGLTVAEAMWKERPVVASRIGGIQDQIDDGESGVLISDPGDLSEFGGAVVGLLQEPERARRIGTAARLRVRDHFLGVHHLGRYFELIQALVAQPADSVAAAERGS